MNSEWLLWSTTHNILILFRIKKDQLAMATGWAGWRSRSGERARRAAADVEHNVVDNDPDGCLSPLGFSATDF